MPLPVLLAAGNLLGGILAFINNRSKRIARTNLDICFPDKNEVWRHRVLKQSLKENSKTLLESLWLWRNSSLAISELCGKIINEELLDNCARAQYGTIFVAPHFGSWEYAGLLTASRCDLMILYAPPKIPYVHKISYRGRSSTGASMADTTKFNIKNLVGHLKQGGCIGILPDQVPPGNGGVYAPFFGRMAYTGTLLIKLARRYQCEVVIGYSLRRQRPGLVYDTYCHCVPKELFANDDESAARELNALIETIIVQEPEQYLWTYKRFKRPVESNPYS